MRRSHAQEALNRTEFVEGGDIQEHIKLLRTRKIALDNLSPSAMSDDTWKGIIIRSIPTTLRWLPVIPILYTLSTSADVFSMLQSHGMVLDRGSSAKGPSSASGTVLAARTTEGCKNPNCKARKKSSHSTDNCYWPGGGTVSPEFWPEVQGECYHNFRFYPNYHISPCSSYLRSNGSLCLICTSSSDPWTIGYIAG